MHGRNLGIGGLCEEEVQTLRLTDEGSTIGRQVDDRLHGNLPRRAVELAKLRGNLWDALNGPVVRNDLSSNVRSPAFGLDKVLHEILVDHDELACQDTAGVQVAGEGLNALVVAENLGRAGRRHGGDEE